jgi:hypothetical protein
MQEPPLHVWLCVVQFVEFAHVPLLHVCTVLPEHWVIPGEHEPVHWPIEHVEFVQGVVIPH